jgi:hypothetical protein
MFRTTLIWVYLIGIFEGPKETQQLDSKELQHETCLKFVIVGASKNSKWIRPPCQIICARKNKLFQMEVVGLACVRGMDLHIISLACNYGQENRSKYCLFTDFWHLLDSSPEFQYFTSCHK